METFKIQIIHEELITKKELSTILYNEIGEEYNLSEDDIEDLFEILDTFLLPNNTFSTNFTFSIPDLELRDIEPKDIIFSYLNSLESDERVISIVKTFDSILYKTAEKYYNEIIKLEMKLRNVLTYILSYDDKSIEDQLFKNFGIDRSQKINYEDIRKKYENGLFYIYFNHYASFSVPKKIKADQIAELLQDLTIQTFEDFKNKISNRAIKEDRHTDFLLSIKNKLKPLEDMRNAIMHIRNLSNTIIANYEKAITGNNGDKGIHSIIEEFWNNERRVLNKETWLALSKNQIKKLITVEEEAGSKTFIFNSEYYDDEFENSYNSIEDFKDDLFSYLVDKIELRDFDTLNDEFQRKINELIYKLL